ncbi:MAG: AAA family ATPase [Candidatus Omnitrophica bacterium]|nr:AAA family ATPase [Candidatus Omnitrophota bacterium]
MYEKFYGFAEKPFNTTPDSKFFFPSAKHTEALNSLVYAISERKGFVVITGEIGAGKTTVSRTLLNKLEVNTKVAVITNTHLTARELISEILSEFGVEYKSGSKQKLLSQLNDFLIQQLAADINVVLIIDEAQNLTPTVLEEVRMLSNLETEKEKLIQIILMGQPQLKAKLENPKLEQFKQRIAVYYHLRPLSKNETAEYIIHRLKTVSNNGVEQIFSEEAIELIYNHSTGIPRIINLVCDSALLSGYIYDCKKINDKIICEVIKERELSANTLEIIEEVKETAQPPKIFCCVHCQKYAKCETKWDRGIKGQEQLCCPTCHSYTSCVENTKKIKLN